ncbi:hypothetical protein FRC11_013651 [Ceratobasidium sp. 423]|nr:hypothetical protein FRC11_013651 [Ceratobasidium sp. 423]
MMHGPLQAEHLKMEDAAQDKKKQDNKAACEEKVKEKAEEKACWDREKLEEKACKDREKVEKAMAAAVAAGSKKGKAAASKQATNNTTGHAAGDLDTEINAVGVGVTDVDIRPIIMNKPTKSWTKQEILGVKSNRMEN